ncbi:MAG: cupin domain-containing protein [Planctomycetes bacterium]|nr:cupin domain-containing protein [Planctomycetota bacterium]
MLTIHANQVPAQSFDWGTLQWLANAELLPGTSQTLGICHLFGGKANPMHYHPNCEEILYVQQGTGRHLLDEHWIDVRPGSVVRIPIGMKHKLVNEGPDTMITIIAFSSGDRQTVFLE